MNFRLDHYDLRQSYLGHLYILSIAGQLTLTIVVYHCPLLFFCFLYSYCPYCKDVLFSLQGLLLFALYLLYSNYRHSFVLHVVLTRYCLDLEQ